MAQEQPRDVAGSPMIDLPEERVTTMDQIRWQTRHLAIEQVMKAQPNLPIGEVVSRAKAISEFVLEGKVPLAAD